MAIYSLLFCAVFAMNDSLYQNLIVDAMHRNYDGRFKKYYISNKPIKGTLISSIQGLSCYKRGNDDISISFVNADSVIIALKAVFFQSKFVDNEDTVYAINNDLILDNPKLYDSVQRCIDKYLSLKNQKRGIKLFNRLTKTKEYRAMIKDKEYHTVPIISFGIARLPGDFLLVFHGIAIDYHNAASYVSCYVQDTNNKLVHLSTVSY